MSSSLQNDLFKTIEDIAYKVIDGVPRDLTVTARVVEVRNVESGQYRVSYQSNTMTAYSLDPLTVYAVGADVYVLVPRGDYSARKLILGLGSGLGGMSQHDRQEMMNQWTPIGPNWLSPEWYWRSGTTTPRTDPRDQDIIALHPDNLVPPNGIASIVDQAPTPMAERLAWRGELFLRDPSIDEFRAYRGLPTPTGPENARTRPPEAMMNLTGLQQVDNVFIHHANQLEYFQIRGNFQTTFSNVHNAGDYGIIVECLVENPNYALDTDGYGTPPEGELPFIIVTYKFSALEHFNGNPRQLNVPTPQSAVFPIPRTGLRGLVRVALYQDNGFATDIQPHYDGADVTWEVPPATLVLDKNNIHVTDLQIHFVQRLNLTDSLFHIRVVSPDGLTVNENNLDVRLQARLFYGRNDITSEEHCKFYWFREKVDATTIHAAGRRGSVTDHDEYGRNWHRYGGDGWAPIAWPFPNNGYRVGLAYRAPGTLGAPDNHNFGQWPGGEVPNYVVEAINVPRPPADPPGHRPEDLPAPMPHRRAAFNELVVPLARVPWRWRYKVVCVYNGVPPGGDRTEDNRQEVIVDNGTNLSASTVWNTDTLFDFELPNHQNGMSNNNVFLRVRNNNYPWEEYPTFDESLDPWLAQDWWCRWWFIGSNGTNVILTGDDFNNQYLAGRLRINNFLNMPTARFAAQIYAPVRETAAWPNPPGAAPVSSNFPIVPDQNTEYIEIGVVHRTIIQPGENPFTVEFAGPTRFHFFADGTSRLEDWNAPHTITAHMTWRDNEAGTYSVEWIAQDGLSPVVRPPGDALHTVEGIGIDDPLSMMFGVWATTHGNVNNENALHFRVREHYDRPARPNNTFIFRVRMFDGRIFDSPLVIEFMKDGASGTNGSPWAIDLWPVNSGELIDGLPFDPFYNKLHTPRPLRLSGTMVAPGAEQTGGLNLPLHIRPHITKHGESLEKLPRADGYTAKITWDVRYAEGGWDRHPCETIIPEMQVVAGRSLIRLADPSGLNLNLHREVNWYPTGPDESRVFNYSDATVRIRWQGGDIGLSLAQLNFTCIVRARVDIFKDSNPDGPTPTHGTHITTLFDYYPVELLIGSTANINSAKMRTNWPKYVNYDAAGYNPQMDINAPMYFYYGDRADDKNPPLPISAEPTNLTVVPLGTRPAGLARLARIVRPFIHRREWKYDPFPHFLAGEWRFDSIRTILPTAEEDVRGDFADWGTAVFIRPVIYRLITHGNAAINAWDGNVLVPRLTPDGRALDGETILAPTVGAGWKDAGTNTFTGVIMGINTSRTKVAYNEIFGGFPDVDASPLNGVPGERFMTGIFGYQNGFSSFGIMENGVAYFGRPDRGRIVMDGINGQIYGGGSRYAGINHNGGPDFPHGNDNSGGRGPMPMWNRMRLSLIDFRNSLDPPTGKPNRTYRPGDDLASTPGQRISGYEGEFCDGMNNPEILINTGPLEIDYRLWQYFSWASVNAPEEPNPELDPDTEQDNSRSGFASGTGYSTPAIEIGQYDPERIEEMLRVLNVCDVRGRELAGYQRTINQLQIPGYRRFLVTYDGTMYAMNAFIKGNIVGSNIIGSQFFNWDGTFAVTQRGNLGIGKGPTWTASSVTYGPMDDEVSGTPYWYSWSDQMPGIIEYNPGDYILKDPFEEEEGDNLANWMDFFGLGCGDPEQEPEFDPVHHYRNTSFNFFVTNTGRVLARDLHIGGGSLNIGNFYIIGSDLPNGDPHPRGGDVVSYGTMYLVGTQHPPGKDGESPPWFSTDPDDYKNAIEAWGNCYFRGALANLGEVFLGSAIEKLNPESYERPDIYPPPRPGSIPNPLGDFSRDIVPSSFNSPISITPSKGTAPELTADPIPDPTMPTQIGVWPLYFRVLGNHPNPDSSAVGDDTSDIWNTNWAVLSTGDGDAANNQGENGYMPGFAYRAWNNIGRPSDFNSHAQLDPPVIWRVDQLGMWTDGIFWTHAELGSTVPNQDPMNIERDGLGFIGYVRTVGGFRYNDDIFLIKNLSDDARSMNIESSVDIRILSGQYANRRNGDNPTPELSSHLTDSRVFLESWVRFPAAAGNHYRRGGVLALEASQDSDRLAGSAGAISLIAHSVNRPRNITNNNIQAAIILNALDFDLSPIEDEEGRCVTSAGEQPSWGPVGDQIHADEHRAGRMWFRGAAAAFDMHTVLSSIHDSSVYDTSFRINRNFDGDHSLSTGGDFPWGFGSDANINARANNMVFMGWQERVGVAHTGHIATTPTFVLKDWYRILFTGRTDPDHWDNPDTAGNFPPGVRYVGRNPRMDLFGVLMEHTVIAGPNGGPGEIWLIDQIQESASLETEESIAGLRIGARDNRTTFTNDPAIGDRTISLVGEQITIGQNFGLRNAVAGPNDTSPMDIGPRPHSAINITDTEFFITHDQESHSGENFIITNGSHGMVDPTATTEWFKMNRDDQLIRMNTDNIFEITTRIAGEDDIEGHCDRTWITLIGDAGQVRMNAGDDISTSLIGLTRNYAYGSDRDDMDIDEAIQSIGICEKFTKTNHDYLNIMQVNMYHDEEELYADRSWIKLHQVSDDETTSHMNAATRLVISVDTECDHDVDTWTPWAYLYQDEDRSSWRANAGDEISLTLASDEDDRNVTAIGAYRAIGIHDDHEVDECIGDAWAGISHDHHILLQTEKTHGYGVADDHSWLHLGHGVLIMSAEEEIGFTLGWDDACSLMGMTNGILLTEHRFYMIHENAIVLWVDGAAGEDPAADEQWIKLYGDGSIRGNAEVQIGFSIGYDSPYTVDGYEKAIGINEDLVGLTHEDKFVIRVGQGHGEDLGATTSAALYGTDTQLFMTLNAAAGNLVISNGLHNLIDPVADREFIRLRRTGGLMRMNADQEIIATVNVAGSAAAAATQLFLQITRTGGNFFRGNTLTGGEIGFTVNHGPGTIVGAQRGFGSISGDRARFIAVDNNEIYIYANSNIHATDVVGAHQWFRMRGGNSGLTTINGGTGSVTLHLNSDDMQPAGGDQPWLRINWDGRRAHMNGGGAAGVALVTVGVTESTGTNFNTHARAFALENARMHLSHPSEILLHTGVTGTPGTTFMGVFGDGGGAALPRVRINAPDGVGHVSMSLGHDTGIAGSATRVIGVVNDNAAMVHATAARVQVGGAWNAPGGATARLSVEAATIILGFGGANPPAPGLRMTTTNFSLHGFTALNQEGIAARFG